jgi:hypothetical protein
VDGLFMNLASGSLVVRARNLNTYHQDQPYLRKIGLVLEFSMRKRRLNLDRIILRAVSFHPRCCYSEKNYS